MSQYFYGYIEYKKDGKWYLLHNLVEPENKNPVVYSTCGALRDALREHELGTAVQMTKDPTYVAPPIEKDAPFWMANYKKERYIVSDDISDELKDIINKEWDPTDEESMYRNTYYIVTYEDLISKADHYREEAVNKIKEMTTAINSSGIYERLDKIEYNIRLIANGKTSSIFKNIGVTKDESDDEDTPDISSYKDMQEYYEDDQLHWDVQAFTLAAGCLTGISEALGIDSYDVTNVRFVACID